MHIPRLLSAAIQHSPYGIDCLDDRTSERCEVERLAGDSSTADESTWLGAQMLRAVLAFDRLLVQGRSKEQAIHELLSSPGKFTSSILVALSEVELESESMDSRRCPVSSLVPGMILDEDVRTHTEC